MSQSDTLSGVSGACALLKAGVEPTASMVATTKIIRMYVIVVDV